jgi:hypothetical protein
MSNANLPDIMAGMADLEQSYLAALDETGRFVSYAGFPPDNTTLEYPFAYHLWVETEFGRDEGSVPPRVIRDTGGGDSPVVAHTHYLKGYIMLGEGSDEASYLLAAAVIWVDLYHFVYAAHGSMGGLCQYVKVRKAYKVKSDLGGETHKGIAFDLEALSKPPVVVGP